MGARARHPGRPWPPTRRPRPGCGAALTGARGPPPVAPGKKLASIGTGFFVAPDGHIVTNNHVIDGCEIISATAALGGDIATADLIDTDVRNDLALLRTKLPPPATATFRSPADLDSGRPVAVIGYPTQGMAPLKPFFTAGFTTDSDGGIPNIPPTLFQIKAKVRPGNSGGPVLNDSGHVIGVIFAKIDTPGFFQNTGKVVRDIGFVVRNPILFRVLDRHDVTYQTAATGSAVPQDRLLDLSRPFVARIGCWK